MCQYCECGEPKLIAIDPSIKAKVYMGTDSKDNVIIWTETYNGEKIKYYPAFCPECGQKLNQFW